VRNAWGVSATNVGVWWLAHCVVKPIVAIANQEIVSIVNNFIAEIVHKKYTCNKQISNMIYSYGGTYY
jgi:hypothetical protein